MVRAVIYGDSAHFDPRRAIVANLLDVQRPDPREHFLLPLLVGAIQNLTDIENGVGYVPLGTVFSFMQSLGFQPDQAEFGIEQAVIMRLLEQSLGRGQAFDTEIVVSLRVTTEGAYHTAKLIKMFTYLDAIIVDTPILDREYRANIRNVLDIQDRLARAEVFIEYLDRCWSEVESTGDTFEWPSVAATLRNEITNIRFLVDRQHSTPPSAGSMRRPRGYT